MAYVLMRTDRPVGILRYSLFWDSIPFCNLLYIVEDERGKGGGLMLPFPGYEQPMELIRAKAL